MFSAVYPFQFSFSTTEPGLCPDIGPLEQNWVCLQNWLDEDPQRDFYKELA